MDKKKLQDLMNAFDTSSDMSFVEVDGNADDIASPEDVANGNYELQCKTSCEFKKKGAAYSVDMNSPVTSVRERSAVPSDETTQAPASKGKSEGETLKQSANEIAQKQQRLQHIRSILKTSPDNAALRTHEAKLQLEISRILQKMLGTAGVTIKLKSEPMRLDKAIAMCTKKLRLLRETLQINTNQALKDELHDMEDLTSALRQASVDADTLVAAGLDSQLEALQQRLTELKNEQKEKPQADEDLEGAIKQVQDAIRTKTDNSFIPIKECYRVCSKPSAPVHDGDIKQCVKMCVRLMKHVVHHVSTNLVKSN